MSTVAELKSQRSSTKGCITRIKTLVETKLDTLSSTELDCRLGILESYFKQILSYQTSIEKLCPDDAQEHKVRAEIEDLYCLVKSQIVSALQERRGSTSLLEQSVVPSIIPNHNLPTLKLPTFSGNYSEFPRFISSFLKLVDSDRSLTTIEKFNHLLNCLAGAALRTVKAYDVTESNYPKVLEHLKARFDNKYLTVQDHIRSLCNLPKVSKPTADQIRYTVDSANAHLSALHSLGSTEDILDALIIHLVCERLDSDSVSRWEESIDQSTLPSWSECSALLGKRCQYLEARDPKPNSNVVMSSSSSHRSAASSSSSLRKRRPSSNLTSLATSQTSCLFCSQAGHSISKCPNFLELPVLVRFDPVKKKSLCLNCLSKGHGVKQCRSSSCRVCSMPHHTLLHRYADSRLTATPAEINTVTQNPPPVSSKRESSSAVTLVAQDPMHSQIFLASAVIDVRNQVGKYVPARALLDSASQMDFISEHLVQALRLPRERTNLTISGIGEHCAEVRWTAQVHVRSRVTNFQADLRCHVLPQITGLQPERSVDAGNWEIPPNVPLADPLFFQSQRVDLLIGAGTFFDLLCVGQIKLKDNLPILQKTLLGWIIVGRYMDKPTPRVSLLVESPITTKPSHVLDSKDENLEELVERFWKEEEIPNNLNTKLNAEQLYCEKLFRESTRRLADGRFVVKLPFKAASSPHSPSSLEITRRRFFSLERRLARNPELKVQYSKFLQEYLIAGHMEEIKLEELPSTYCFLPHSCVIRPESSTTKLRVVFDASCRDATNTSLNDLLIAGPTIQSDLFSLLIRFRCYKYGLTADIAAMYRQVLVYPEDCNFQLIWWRENSSGELHIFRLKTVTYGTASAPFLATRCLLQLAQEFQTQFPKASQIVEKDFYMDDLLTGADTWEELCQIRDQVNVITKAGQFHLRKWYSNNALLLSEIPETERSKPMQINSQDVIKALGIIWEPLADEFHFNYLPTYVSSSKVTKRAILSEVARLFDPLGLVNPIVVRAKIFLQELWLLKLHWDESIPQDLENRWLNFKDQLLELNMLRIPRLVLCVDKTNNVTLHGFADASLRAFGCCIYVVSTDDKGTTKAHLLAAKSKVAPIRISRSLPCLELCAALLLAKLFSKIRTIYPKPVEQEILWTDSEIVLDWLSCHPSNWKTYVSNRVAEIQELTKGIPWRHVPSSANPADIVSRGMTAEELCNSMWFTGPAFLNSSQEAWPPIKPRHIKADALPERKIQKSVLVCSVDDAFLDQIYSCSNFIQLCRRFAYVLRFTKLLKSKNRSTVQTNELTAGELEHALLHIVWAIQRKAFAEDVRALDGGRDLPSNSKLRNLNPFIEHCPVTQLRVLRVGGRLKLAEMPIEQRFPLLLPSHNPFVEAYIRHLHLKSFHSGPQALVALLREKFWVINARDYARRIVRKCIHCQRYRPRLAQQIMGVLPASRVNISLPFTHSGVDFCGPFQTTYRIRGKAPYKSYVAVFVCFATRAVHIEVVSDLTTEAFIAALKRFVGRRNGCKHLYCDNATNFVGARRRLAELRRAFLQQDTQRELSAWCSQQSIEFHHIPPRAPHFGGLWEAAVKSAKALLFRTLRGSLLTFEELTTVMTQIEGILNSRPISPLSSDPNDFHALTPAHFLNQAPMTSILEPLYPIEKINYLHRWQRVSALHQHFWSRWTKEYTQQLQQRHKWINKKPNIQVGTLVLIHQDDLPPYQWKLGRVIKPIEGPDGNIRVVEIKTSQGVIQRAIQKVAVLQPI